MATVVREKKNWLIHMLYSRRENEECLKIIEECLKASNGLSEYPVYVKAMIRRQQGRIQESLQLFQAATCLVSLRRAGQWIFANWLESAWLVGWFVSRAYDIFWVLSKVQNPHSAANLKQVGRSLWVFQTAILRPLWNSLFLYHLVKCIVVVDVPYLNMAQFVRYLGILPPFCFALGFCLASTNLQ